MPVAIPRGSRLQVSRLGCTTGALWTSLQATQPPAPLKQQSRQSPEHARTLPPSCKGSIDPSTRTASSNNGRMAVRKLNPGKANEVAYCENCAVSAGTLRNCGGANRSASSKRENYLCGRSECECSDIYSGGGYADGCLRDIATVRVCMRRSCIHALTRLTPRVDVFLASNWGSALVVTTLSALKRLVQYVMRPARVSRSRVRECARFHSSTAGRVGRQWCGRGSGACLGLRRVASS